VVIPIPDGTNVEDVEAQLQQFVIDFYPRFGEFIPGR